MFFFVFCGYQSIIDVRKAKIKVPSDLVDELLEYLCSTSQTGFIYENSNKPKDVVIAISGMYVFFSDWNLEAGAYEDELREDGYTFQNLGEIVYITHGIPFW